MMIVSSSSVFVNRLPPQCSLTPEGREKLWVRAFGFGAEKSTVYKAPGAAIEGVAAIWISPEIDVMDAVVVTVDLQAAAGSFLADAPKYASSGVA